MASSSIHSRLFICAVSFAMTFIGGTSLAAPLTWKISGQVAEVSAPFASSSSRPGFSVGDAFEFVFTFDPASTDSNPEPKLGNYFEAMSAGQLAVGSYVVAIEKHPLFVSNDVGGARTDLFGFAGLRAFGVLPGGTANPSNIVGADSNVYSFSGLFGAFEDLTGGMFTSDALPFSAELIESTANARRLSVGWERPLSPGVSAMEGIRIANISVVDVTPIPEPSTLVLMLTALMSGALVVGVRKHTVVRGS